MIPVGQTAAEKITALIGAVNIINFVDFILL
jgi:hypothetical protein